MKFNKFKVGDKVQVVGDFLREWGGDKHFTITNFWMNIDGDYIYEIDGSGAGPLREEWLKKAA